MHFNFQALYLNQIIFKNDKNILNIQYIYKGTYDIILKIWLIKMMSQQDQFTNLKLPQKCTESFGKLLKFFI